MSNETYTPLQIIVASGLLQNQGLQLPATLTNTVAQYNTSNLVSTLMTAIANAAPYGISANVIASMQTIGAAYCPALGASVPTAYANTVVGVQTAAIIPTTVTGGFGQLVLNTGNRYLGNSNSVQFATVFNTAQSFQSQQNVLVFSSANATKYLGSTFVNMDSLITGQITQVTLATKALGRDLQAAGRAIDLGEIDRFGSPALLLQAVSSAANIVQGTLPGLATLLNSVGLSPADIVALCTPEAATQSYTRAQYDTLQNKAYQAMLSVTGTLLQEVLRTLQTTTPNITAMSDLLNTKALFAESWRSLKVTVNGTETFVFDADGVVANQLQNFFNDINYSSRQAATGCDELGKIIPQQQAQAATALAMSLGQIRNVRSLTAAQLAEALI